MTTQTTILLFSHNANSKLTRLDSATTEMTPATSNDPSLSVLSNNANSGSRSLSSTEISRKSHDKTISGLFAYTNGADVDTGYSDHRLDHIRSLKSNSIHSTDRTGATANGSAIGPNGVVKGNSSVTGSTAGRQSQHSKAGSTRSIGSNVTSDRARDSHESGTGTTRHYASSDGPSRLSNVEHMTDDTLSSVTSGHEMSDTKQMVQETQRNNIDTNRHSEYENTAQSPRSGSHLVEPSEPRHRLSSPPVMTAIPTQDRHIDPAIAEAPRLTHRHTLQVPRGSGTLTRDSRDFSFSAGDEAFATGRFSPTRDNFEASTPRHRRPSFGLVRKTTRSMASDAHLDEVLPDEDAARWTEVIKQKRASRRKRREEEDDDRVIVGKKVEEGHVNWVTAYNMLTGIRFTVSRTNAKMDRELTDADFDARHKFSFDITGNELTPSAKYDFKFKDYSPWVFRRLRAIFGLDPADYLMSLTSKYILSELGSPGKSGSFFYFSRDYKYIIKTIHHAEHKLLRKILREYYTHVRDNPNTLISQFYGLHRVKIPYGRKIHFVVMNNLFPPHRDIHQTFDLKGSTIGRDFKEDDLAENPRATLKDLNWLRRDLHLEFEDKIKKAFLDQITKDVGLLQKLHIMDYSLLVGMHDLEKGNEENVRETTLQVFQPGGERDEDDIPRGSMLTRTPSRLENARKARELRMTLKKEKPTPMSLVQAKMPDEMVDDTRKSKLFYSDDGGIRATHEDGSGGDQVYYLGVIDCLTHYGFVKRIEHFWKGLSSPSMQISPIPPEAYGDRFVQFITGITITKEEASRRRTLEGDVRESVDAHNALHHHHLPAVVNTNLGRQSNEKETPSSPTTTNPAVENTMQQAQTQVDKATPAGKSRRESEDEVPDRVLKTIDVENQQPPRNSTTLPVVEEVGEGGSDVSRSVSREKPKTTEQNQTGIRQVSESTSGQRNSTENEKEKEKEKETLFSADSEHGLCHSPRGYASLSDDEVNNAFRPIPSTTTTTETQSQKGPVRDKPPRLGSGLIPHLEPMYTNLDALNSSGLDIDEKEIGRAR